MLSISIFGMFAGVYHWFPRMYGRLMYSKLGYLHFWLTFIGVYGVFLPMHFVGLAGVPRRYYTNLEFEMFADVQFINPIITAFAIMAAIGQSAFIFNFFYSIFRGRKSSQNPWKSNTLEWTAPIERIHGNWEGPIPTVHRWPYDYSKPGYEDDYVSQIVPLKEGEHEGH